MSRRSSWGQTIIHSQREAERQRVAQIRAQSRAAREAERAQRAYDHAVAVAVAANEKERKRLHGESRQAAVDLQNADLHATTDRLQGLLSASLEVDNHFNLDRLKETQRFPIFDPGPLGMAAHTPDRASFQPTEPTGLTRFLPHVKQRHAAAAAAGEEEYARACAIRAGREERRRRDLAAARAEHDRAVEAERLRFMGQHAEIEQFKGAIAAADPAAIASYCTLVLEASAYPDEFPQESKLAYVPESKQLVLEYDFPSFSVIPETAAYRYIKARDEIGATPRPAAQRKSLYASVIAQITVRTLHELFDADRSDHLDTIVFNGYVEAIDPSTGRPNRTCLVTVRTTRDTFARIDLRQVEPVACLKGLHASVSKSPSEFAPVRPVLEFSMVDARFVAEADVLAVLDQRANLMDLSPSEFESLITNLFHAMGLEARQTQASRDGGVDCVAYDPRPIFGGKVVIQAKRYKHTVGVSAVRDLFGTVQNEGASKGILVTTSGYGKAAYDFAQNKPLELLDGGNLLYLLKEHANLDARIEAPEGWRDPLSDGGMLPEEKAIVPLD